MNAKGRATLLFSLLNAISINLFRFRLSSAASRGGGNTLNAKICPAVYLIDALDFAPINDTSHEINIARHLDDALFNKILSSVWLAHWWSCNAKLLLSFLQRLSLSPTLESVFFYLVV
jgi:hypothetical protein